MIKTTHKTIQDYFRPASRPSRRETAIAGRAPRFESLLKGIMTEEPAADGQTGLTIRDYLDRSRGGIAVGRGLRPSVAAASLPNGKDQAGGSTPAAPMDPASVAATPSPAVSPAREMAKIRQAIQRAAVKYNVPAALVHSVIRCESNFDPQALSPAGAQGLMQLMPGTAGDLGVHDPFDIEQNVDGGTRYLRLMLDRFEGDVELALAAYNAGPGTVNRYGGVPPYRETQAYVQKVMRMAEKA